MSSALSKRQRDRNERTLQELMKQPGNERCADCGGRNPGWASWNLGIFLCMQCASLHRKLGTHLSKVKSCMLDAWTNEQVENMRKIGNKKSNAYWNPEENRYPPPLDPEEETSAMERYIRDKYQYGHFKADKTPNGKPVEAPTTKVNGVEVPIGLSLNTNVKFPSTMVRSAVDRGTSSSVSRVQQHNTGRSSPGSKVHQILGVEPVHSKPQGGEPKSGLSFTSNPTPSTSGITALEDKLKQLKDMGFVNEKRNLDILRGTGGDMVATVETLVRLDSSLPQTPASATSAHAPSHQFASVPANTNPFGAPHTSDGYGFGPSQRNVSAPALADAQSGQQLFPHRTGGAAGLIPQQTGYNPFAQQQAVPPLPQVPHTAIPQNQPQSLNIFSQTPYQQQQQYGYSAPLTAPIQPAPSNPFFQPSPISPQQYNPFMNGTQMQSSYSQQQQQQQQQQPPHSANSLAPLLQQVSLSTQFTGAPPQSYTQQPQPQVQPQYQQQTAGQPVNSPYNHLFSPSPLAPQTTSSSTSSHLNKSAILSLYNSTPLLPTPPPSQPSTSTQSLADTQQSMPSHPNGNAAVQDTANHSNNPFLPANAAKLGFGRGGGKHTTQESVDFGSWKSGRHSPDAFASLSFRQ